MTERTRRLEPDLAAFLPRRTDGEIVDTRTGRVTSGDETGARVREAANLLAQEIASDAAVLRAARDASDNRSVGDLNARDVSDAGTRLAEIARSYLEPLRISEEAARDAAFQWANTPILVTPAAMPPDATWTVVEGRPWTAPPIGVTWQTTRLQREVEAEMAAEETVTGATPAAGVEGATSIVRAFDAQQSQVRAATVQLTVDQRRAQVEDYSTRLRSATLAWRRAQTEARAVVVGPAPDGAFALPATATWRARDATRVPAVIVPVKTTGQVVFEGQLVFQFHSTGVVRVVWEGGPTRPNGTRLTAYGLGPHYYAMNDRDPVCLGRTGQDRFLQYVGERQYGLAIDLAVRVINSVPAAGDAPYYSHGQFVMLVDCAEQGCEWSYTLASNGRCPLCGSNRRVGVYDAGLTDLTGAPTGRRAPSEPPAAEVEHDDDGDGDDEDSGQSTCVSCEARMDDVDMHPNPGGDPLCPSCFQRDCVWCDFCNEVAWRRDAETTTNGTDFCSLECLANRARRRL